MRILRFLAVAALFQLLVSCASTGYAPRVETSFKPGDQTVVVYGHLTFTDNTSSMDDSGYRMALRFWNEETKRPLYIRFSKTEPLACAAIQPGNYQLTGFVATDSSDHVKDGKLFGPEDKINLKFSAGPNAAVYIGDFSGYVKHYVYGALTTTETGLTDVTNNFSETTKSFHELYPNLAAVPTHSVFDNAGK